MRAWTLLILPVVFSYLLMLLFLVYPGASLWGVSPYLYLTPHLLFGIAFLLGAFFTQSRVSFLSILFMAVTYLAERAVFENRDCAASATIILLATIYVPPFVALLYRLSERGIFTIHGYIRMGLVVSAIVVMFLLQMIKPLNEAVLSAQSVLFSPLCGWCRIPLLGLLLFFLSIPLLLIRNKHESPMLGSLLCLAMLFILGALNLKARMWKPEQEQAVFLLFASASGLSLIWAVLESSWRNAHIDELTELPGRRTLKHHLARLGGSFSIVMLDIDFFKKINDKYGHDTGDQVLRFIAAQIKEKQAGKAYRYGGEEFAIVCENCSCSDKIAELEDLRKAIEKNTFWIRGKDRPRKKTETSRRKPTAEKPKGITITVSIGVAEKTDGHPSPQEVLEAADKALYRAKESGRNCIKVAR
jgi:GGDEF domain-containing protein